MVALELYTNFNCYPVFLGNELKDKYYKGKGRAVPVPAKIATS